MPELKTDPRFAERNTRIRNREKLRGIIEQVLQAKSAGEWERLFDEAGVPAGPILTIPEVMAHAQIEDRQLIKRFKNVAGIGRSIAVVRVGFRLASGQPDVDTPPPQVGQDTVAILDSIRYRASDIEDLRQQGVI